MHEVHLQVATGRRPLSDTVDLDPQTTVIVLRRGSVGKASSVVALVHVVWVSHKQLPSRSTRTCIPRFALPQTSLKKMKRADAW